MSDKLRMLWVAVDSDCEVWIHDAPPIWNGGAWGSTSIASKVEDDDFCPGLQPGECRMFIEFAPRVADGLEGEAPVLAWGGNGWTFMRRFGTSPGDIILPMPPDPTPYLAQHDPKAARRKEIRAQIAELQAELDGMEG